MTADTIADLIEAITTHPYGIPVRAMERLLAIAADAVEPLCDALERWQDDDSREILWLIVVLGELRGPVAIAALVQQISRAGFDLFATAAKALVKIGKPALPATLIISPAIPKLKCACTPTRFWAGGTMTKVIRR